TGCTTYKAYQKHKQNLPSFAAFCREAAVELSKRNKASQPLKPISENIPEASTFEVGSTFSYKKRLHFETETRIENALQRSCVLCRRLNHDSENQGHSCLGYKTSFECIVCKVSLCRAKRWDEEQSCFEIFHAVRKLPHPCKHSEHLRSTKKNENRASPPLRNRSTSLDGLPTRVPSVRLASKK
ncbi:Hypothetical protein PHPALM_5695, partial [Phytophthora palmivora]